MLHLKVREQIKERTKQMMNFVGKLAVLFAVILFSVSPAFAEGEENPEETFTGVYKDKQIIPNLMATLCKMNAEDAVKDNNKLYKCVNQLIIKATHKNAATRDDGVKDLESIRVEELKIMLALAVSKGASIADFEDPENGIIKRLSDANDNEQTEHDDNAAIVNTNATLMALINSMRDLYAENLKYVALSNISTISKDVIEDYLTEEEKQKIAEEEEKAKTEVNIEGSDADMTKVTSKYTTDSPYVTDWKYVENNQCERKVCVGEGEDISAYSCQKETKVCPDGTYFDPQDASIGIVCEHEVCTLVADKHVDGEVVKTEYTGSNKCSVTRSGPAGEVTNIEACPDGEHKTSDGQSVLCSAGSCTGPYDENEKPDTADGGKVVAYLGDGKCKVEYSEGDGYTSEEPCPDGKFKTATGVSVECVGGSCAGTLDEDVVVEGNAPKNSPTYDFLNNLGLGDYVNPNGSVNIENVLADAGVEGLSNEDGTISISSVVSGLGFDNYLNEDGSVYVGSVLSGVGVNMSADGNIGIDDLLKIAGSSDGKSVDLNKLFQTAGVPVELPSGMSTISESDLNKIRSSTGQVNMNDLIKINIGKTGGTGNAGGDNAQ